MKVELTKGGVLVITPETGVESYALNTWWDKQSWGQTINGSSMLLESYFETPENAQ